MLLVLYPMKNLSFSGHDSFPCRPYWLKKGFDFVKAKKNVIQGFYLLANEIKAKLITNENLSIAVLAKLTKEELNNE